MFDRSLSFPRFSLRLRVCGATRATSIKHTKNNGFYHVFRLSGLPHDDSATTEAIRATPVAPSAQQGNYDAKSIEHRTKIDLGACREVFGEANCSFNRPDWSPKCPEGVQGASKCSTRLPKDLQKTPEASSSVPNGIPRDPKDQPIWPAWRP